MTHQNLKFRASREALFSDDIGLRVWAAQEGGVALLEPIAMRFYKNEEMTAIADRGPDVILSMTSAQQLMDELWHVGLRPSEGSGSAGSLAATQKHLADMRALVAKSHAVEMPK